MFRLLPMLVVVLLASITNAQPLRGSIQEQAYYDYVSNRIVYFNVYLPEGYLTSTESYPVVYHLHGLNGHPGGPHNMYVPRSFEAAQDAGVIGPVIVVFPDGYTNAWWADSFDGDQPAEFDLVSSLVPHVDANYRTVPRAGARVIQGFSMGGFGATKFYSKFPDIFSVCVEYDGAFVTWSGMQLMHAQVASEIFGNSEEYFNQFSPWAWTDSNATLLRSRNSVRMVVGALAGANRSFREHLYSNRVPFNYVETICGHDLSCLLEYEGRASAAFIAERLSICAADHNSDGDVTSQDFFDFLTAFFGAAPSADFNNDASVNSQDFFEFMAAFFTPC